MAAQHDAITLGAPLHSDGHVEGRRRKHYGPLVGLGIDPPHPGNHSSLLIRARLRVAEEDVLQRVAVEDPSEENLAARVADAAVLGNERVVRVPCPHEAPEHVRGLCAQASMAATAAAAATH